MYNKYLITVLLITNFAIAMSQEGADTGTTAPDTTAKAAVTEATATDAPETTTTIAPEATATTTATEEATTTTTTVAPTEATTTTTATTVITSTVSEKTTKAAPSTEKSETQSTPSNADVVDKAVDTKVTWEQKGNESLTCGDAKCHMYSICNNSTNVCICASVYTDILAPVCGSDGKTYDNEGHLHVDVCVRGVDVTKVSDGACTAKSEGDNASKKTLIIVIVALLVLLLILVIVVIVYKKKRTRSSNLKKEKATDQLL